MSELAELEMQWLELTNKLHAARCQTVPTSVPDYQFHTVEGSTNLSDLFAGEERLLVIHNMGQGCRYCTLWGDGLNGLLPHLESMFAVVMVSRDEPQLQRQFANSRGWRFRLASHGGGDYLKEQVAAGEYDNAPGAACYRQQEGRIERLNSTMFGPGDPFCAAWHLLGLAGLPMDAWTPQYRYWQRPAELDDGGENVVD